MRTAAVVLGLTLAVGIAWTADNGTPVNKPATVSGCAAVVDDFFRDEVWAKVGQQSCLTCHKSGGDAEESKFLLLDPRKAASADEAMRQNRAAFAAMAKVKEQDKSRMLLKVVGGLDHGGSNVLRADSTGYRILADFVARTNAPKPPQGPESAVEKNSAPFFDGVVMMDDRRLLRRITLSLAGRLPTDSELRIISEDDLKALPGLMDAIMKEEAFYFRIREGFNDIFLTQGVEGNPDQNVLSYDHFPTRQWYSKYDLTKAGDAQAQQKARYKLTDDYRDSLRDEPMRLIEHIVRNDRPFTEIVTADYVMLSPYSARGYGCLEEIKGRFKNPDDPLEFIPVKIKALIGRNKADNQDSATGFYPHAGLLSTFQYLVRYPTTETNRNRLRARMYYQHFLGVDVLELAARVTDAAEAQAKYEIPTMQAAECVVCHRTLDPVAGLFQDYWRFAERGVYGKRKGGWFKDMFGPGFEGENMPESERWRALQWLGERTAKDPRFAVAMVEHVYYIMTGRRPLLPPKDVDDPLYAARRRAYQVQRCEIESIAARFAKNGFNLKDVFKDLAVTDMYRADGLATAVDDPKRRAELDDVAVARLLSPEQLDRKVGAIFGKKWGRLDGQNGMLYGGIDSKAVTERATDPSGAMGAIQRILSNDVARNQVPDDFKRPQSERVLFRHVEPSLLPGMSSEGDAAIRRQIAHLHERILGRVETPESADVERTWKLFSGIVAEARRRKDAKVPEEAARSNFYPPNDPHYTVRAWIGVVTYLMRRPEFIYE